jgi:membrane protein YqaA with SNARE-associated domain
MIIWRGLGILVPFVAGGILMLTLYLVDLAMKNPEYSKWHYWPKAVSGILAAAAIWYLGRYLNSRPGKVVVEKDTGQEIEIRKVHDVFFVKFEYWGVIIAIFTVWGYFV